MVIRTSLIMFVYVCLNINTLGKGLTCMKRVENYLTPDVKLWTRSWYTTRLQCVVASLLDEKCKGVEYISEGLLCTCLSISNSNEAARPNSCYPFPVQCSPGQTNIFSGHYSAYIGCYVDRKDRIVYENMYTVATMTIAWCLQKCFDGGYVYAGLQAGNQCFCGNEKKPSVKRPDAECNRQCAGDTSLYCGGWWRVAVYHFP